MRGFAALCVAASLIASSASAQEAPAKRWEAGAYSFSDELGGFLITGASGKGTKADPFVIREEFNLATPVTLVIRTIRPIRPFDQSGELPAVSCMCGSRF